MSSARSGTEQLIPTAPASSLFATEIARWKSRVYIEAAKLSQTEHIPYDSMLTKESKVRAVGFAENVFHGFEGIHYQNRTKYFLLIYF